MRLDPAFEPLVQAMSGMVTINGDPAGPPSRLPISAVDMAPACGPSSACWSPYAAGGNGPRMRRANLVVRDGPRLALAARQYPGERRGRTSARADVGTLRSRPVSIVQRIRRRRFRLRRERSALQQILLDTRTPEWIADPAFATNRARLTNRERLVPMIAATVAAQSRDYWCAHLGAAGVPCAPVNTLPEALALEQFTASKMLSPPLGNGAMQLVGYRSPSTACIPIRWESGRSSAPTTRSSTHPLHGGDSHVNATSCFRCVSRSGFHRRSGRSATLETVRVAAPPST